MGGVGKTQLAAAHARRALASRTTVVVWVTASSRQAIIDAYAQAATTLGLPGCAGTDPAADASHFLTWTTTTGRSWLVVLDDIQDPKDVSKLWPPADAQGRVLATTRRRDAALAGQGRRLVPIDTYSPAEARAYLTDRLTSHHRAEPTEQIDGLAADLGFLPLALAQAAAYLLDDGIAIAAYRALLAEQTLEGVKPGSLPDDHEQIVASTWALSIDRADTAYPAGMARPLLELLSVLDPNGIPYSVLTSSPVLVRLAVDTPDLVRRGLRVLHGFNLITLTTRPPIARSACTNSSNAPPTKPSTPLNNSTPPTLPPTHSRRHGQTSKKMNSVPSSAPTPPPYVKPPALPSGNATTKSTPFYSRV